MARRNGKDSQALCRSQKFLLDIQKWKKNSKKKRVSLQKLAEKTGCTVSQIRTGLKKTTKKLRKVTQKSKIAHVAPTVKSAAEARRKSGAILVSSRSCDRIFRPYRIKREREKARVLEEFRMSQSSIVGVDRVNAANSHLSRMLH